MFETIEQILRHVGPGRIRTGQYYLESRGERVWEILEGERRIRGAGRSTGCSGTSCG